MDSQANEAILDGEPNDVKSSDLREDDDIINDKSHSHSSDGASAGKIFIGGLARETTDAQFVKHFGKYGDIIDSVIMKDRKTGQPRGFGFVTYAEPSVVDKVIEDTHVINGKQVEIKRTIPKGAIGSKDIRTKKIFVGGIPATVNEDEFRDFFAQFGEVKEHQIMRDHSTSRSRGFGFISFDTEQAVDDLLSRGNRLELAGAQVEIKKAEPKKPNPPPAPSRRYNDSRPAFSGGFRDSGYGGFGGSSFGGGSGGGYRSGGPYGGGRSSAYGGYGGSEFGGYGGYGVGGGMATYREEPYLGYSSRYGGGGFSRGYDLGGSYGGPSESYGGYSSGGSGAAGGGYGSSYDASLGVCILNDTSLKKRRGFASSLVFHCLCLCLCLSGCKMVASAISVPLSFSIASRSRTSSIPLFSRRNSTRSIVSALPGPYSDSSTLGLSSKTCWLPSKHEEKDFPGTSTSYDAIEARKGNPPVMPAVMTPGGPLDLSSVLFRNRIIFIGQPVNSQVAQRVISQLVTLATIDEDADILVYLNCPGGSTYSVLAIYDCMSWIKPKVGTVCFGVAASQGALLLAGGEKGMRYAMPNARIMIHQPQSGCGGHVEDVRRQVNEAVQSRHKIDKMYAAFTGQPLEKVQQYTERDRFLSVSEAMEFGLIDGVLETEY